MRLSLYKNMPVRTIILACVVWLALGLLPSAAQVDDTLAKIRATGEVRCGVSEGLRGFSRKENTQEQ